MQVAAIRSAVTALRDAYDALAACDVGTLTRDELLPLLDELESLGCQLPTQWQRMLARLRTETTPRELGAKTWNEVLRTRWRLSSGEAGRRLAEADDLQPRPVVSGPPLPPVLPATAAAQAQGLLTGEHVKVLRETMRDIPDFVDPTTRSQVEVDLVRVAIGVGPKELRDTAKLRLFLLDQDGPEPDDAERARKRGVTKGRQGRDGLTALTAHLDPETAAIWEVLFAKFAAPGMCNPADADICTLGTPSQSQIDNDHRTLAQRQHDALKAIGRIALMTDLGQLNGLPVSIIIRTTLADLESRAGAAVTGGGTVLTMTDLERLGGHAAYHLCVFDGATGSALNHFRGKRVATPAQRIMLIAKYGGCTKPDCTVGPYGCQIHHAVDDYADGGNTNVDEMAPACGPDNRSVKPGGWTTRITETGECEWIPPEHLDHGQARINTYHRPELLLHPPDGDTWPWEPTPPTPEPTPIVDDVTTPASAVDNTAPAPMRDDDEMPFPPGDTPPPAPRWTEADEAAFNKRFPNGPFADYPDDEPATATEADDPDPADADIDESAPEAGRRRAECRSPRTEPARTTDELLTHGFTRYNATGLLSTSTTTRTRTRHELRRLLTHCTRKPPGDNP
jgi:hypothetical protein